MLSAAIGPAKDALDAVGQVRNEAGIIDEFGFDGIGDGVLRDAEVQSAFAAENGGGLSDAFLSIGMNAQRLLDGVGVFGG